MKNVLVLTATARPGTLNYTYLLSDVMMPMFHDVGIFARRGNLNPAVQLDASRWRIAVLRRESDHETRHRQHSVSLTRPDKVCNGLSVGVPSGPIRAGGCRFPNSCQLFSIQE